MHARGKGVGVHYLKSAIWLFCSKFYFGACCCRQICWFLIFFFQNTKGWEGGGFWNKHIGVSIQRRDHNGSFLVPKSYMGDDAFMWGFTLCWHGCTCRK